jgi:protein CMS1
VPGSPHTLVLSPAALRVADLTRYFFLLFFVTLRVLKKFKTQSKADIAKLFARHFKLSEHISYVRKTLINIAVGTPGRIRALVEAEDGVLKLAKLRYLVIDANYTDGKRRTIFDIPETLKDLFGVLERKEIRKRIADDKLRVVFY